MSFSINVYRSTVQGETLPFYPATITSNLPSVESLKTHAHQKIFQKPESCNFEDPGEIAKEGVSCTEFFMASLPSSTPVLYRNLSLWPWLSPLYYQHRNCVPSTNLNMVKSNSLACGCHDLAINSPQLGTNTPEVKRPYSDITDSGPSSGSTRSIKRFGKEEFKAGDEGFNEGVEEENEGIEDQLKQKKRYKHDLVDVNLCPMDEEIADFKREYLLMLKHSILLIPGMKDSEQRNRLCDAFRAFLKLLAYRFGFGSLGKAVLITSLSGITLDYSYGQMHDLWIVFKQVAPKILKLQQPQLFMYFKHAILLNVNKARKRDCEMYLTDVDSETRSSSIPVLPGKQMQISSETSLDTASNLQLFDYASIIEYLPKKSKKKDFVKILQENEFAKAVYAMMLEEFKFIDRNKCAEYFR